MALHEIKPITAEEENFRTEPFDIGPGMKVEIIRRDHVARLAEGDYVALVFRVTAVERDCDGSALYAIENVDHDGDPTGWTQNALGLDPSYTVKMDYADDLRRIITKES